MKIGLDETKQYTIPCQQGIELLPDECIHLVVTSPPYNIELRYDEGKKKPQLDKFLGKKRTNPIPQHQSHEDALPFPQYIAFLKSVFSQLRRVLVPGARVCINVGDKDNGKFPTHSEIIQFMTKELGYLMRSTVIWEKSNIGNRNAWGSWKSPSNPTHPSPFEYILIFSWQQYNLEGDPSLITITSKDFTRAAYGVWWFPGERTKGKYPNIAMFPVELPRRLIEFYTYRGMRVLDPFSGCGTTLCATRGLDRIGIGFEISGVYSQIAEQRIKDVKPGSLIKIEPPKVLKLNTFLQSELEVKKRKNNAL